MNPLNWSLRTVILVRALLTFLLAFQVSAAVAQTLDAYVHACTGTPAQGTAAKYANCSPQSWTRADANDVVLTGSSWDATNAKWAKFGDLADSAQIEVCWNGASEGSAIMTCRPGAAGFVAKSRLAVTTPVPEVTTQWTVVWNPPATRTDGQPLTNLTGYRLEASPLAAGPWSSVWTGSAPTATVALAGASACFRVSAISATDESDPTSPVCATKSPGAPPNAPVIVGGARKALALVSGASTGLRAVYSRSAMGSRGQKLGDVAVGPVNGDFGRIECDPADSFVYGGNRYARVKAPIGGYVSGCYSVGTH